MTEHEVIAVAPQPPASDEQITVDAVTDSTTDAVTDARTTATSDAINPTDGTPAAAPSKRRRKSADAAAASQPLLFEINLTDPELPSSTMPFELRVEAAILLADRPISDGRIAEVLGLVPSTVRTAKDIDPDTADSDSAAVAGRRREAVRLVREACDTLNQQYAATNRAFRIENVSGGRQMLTIAVFGPILAKMKGARAQTRLSQAALETLAIIAYRQPMLRAQLEAIRGVACGEVLKSLMERRLVKIVGRAEEVGRPMLYGTTPEFLRVFGIANLSDLPQAKDLR